MPGATRFMGLAVVFWVCSIGATAAEYRVERVSRDGIDIYALAEVVSGARAEFAPELGGLGLQLRLAVGGRAYELVPEVRFSGVARNPTAQGMPILFPFPGLMADGGYVWGRWSPMLRPMGTKGENYHGFAASSPWRVLRHGTEADGAALDMELTPDRVEHAEAQYPFAFRFVVRYRLRASELRADFTVENVGDTSMPFAVGLHPYFRRPFVPGVPASAYRFYLDAPNRWIGHDSWRRAEKAPVDAAYDPRAGLIPGRAAAEHFIDFGVTDGWSQCRLVDEDNRLALVMRARRDFGVWVLFATPRQPDQVAIEPYGAIPNAINLLRNGVTDTGLRFLEPDGRFDTAVTIGLEAVDRP